MDKLAAALQEVVDHKNGTKILSSTTVYVTRGDASVKEVGDALRVVHAKRMAKMQERTCTASEPMPLEDKDKFHWHHPDAKEVEPYFNLILCTCPNCKFSFTCYPRES